MEQKMFTIHRKESGWSQQRKKWKARERTNAERNAQKKKKPNRLGFLQSLLGLLLLLIVKEHVYLQGFVWLSDEP
jgi:hypothetical protein